MDEARAKRGCCVALLWIVAVGWSGSALAGTLYWTGGDPQRLRSTGTDGSGETTLLNPVEDPVDLDLDLANEKSYWVERAGAPPDRIRRANLDGTSVETVAEIPDRITGIAVHSSGIYLTRYATGGTSAALSRIDLDGSNLTDLVTDILFPTGVDVDPDNGHVYWGEVLENDGGDESPPGQIRRADLDGSNAVVVIPSSSNLPTDLAVDPQGGKIYWVTDTDCVPCQTIRRANLDGSDNELLISGTSATDIAVDVEGARVYWPNPDFDETVRRMRLDGSDPEVFLETEDPGPLAIDPRNDDTVGVPAASPVSLAVVALVLLAALTRLRLGRLRGLEDGAVDRSCVE